MDNEKTRVLDEWYSQAAKGMRYLYVLLESLPDRCNVCKVDG